MAETGSTRVPRRINTLFRINLEPHGRTACSALTITLAICPRPPPHLPPISILALAKHGYTVWACGGRTAKGTVLS